MAIATKKTPLGGLAGKLLSSSVLSEEIISAAIADAEDKNLPLVRYLIEHNLVDPRTLAELISDQFGLPLLDLNRLTIPSDYTQLVSSNLIEKNAALPLYKHGKRVFVAVADPTNLHGLDELQFNLGEGTVEPIIVEWDKLSKAIDKVVSDTDTPFGDLDDTELDDFDEVEVGEIEEEMTDESDVDDAPVVKFVTKCLLDAIRK